MVVVQAPKTHEEQLGPGTIGVRIAPQSYDAKTRSFEVTLSAGLDVQRYSWYSNTTYIERLSVDPAHVNLERVNSGRAPFLKSHDRWDLDSVIGSIVEGSVRIQDGAIVGRVQMHETDEAARYAERIQRGELPNVSIGYDTFRQLRSSEDFDDGSTIEIRTAIDWQITELSLVTVGADASAHTRTKPDGAMCVVETPISEERAIMPPKDETQKVETGAPGARAAAPAVPATPPAQAPASAPPDSRAAPVAVAEPPVDDPAVRAAAEAATKAERDRSTGIRSAVSRVNLPEKLATRLIDEGVSLDAARESIIDELASTRDPSIDGHISIELDERTKVASATERALLHRANPRAYPLEDSDDARVMAGDTLLELGCRHLARQGFKIDGLGRAERASAVAGNIRLGGAHTPSDFPLILANTTGRVLRDGYMNAPKAFEALVNERPVSDFKPITVLSLSDATALGLVADSGEYGYGTIDESGETYRVLKYGKIIAITRETIINDDLAAFTRIPQRMGAQAARLESQLFWAIVTLNAAMADGDPLFHANHGNVGSGTISTAAIAALDLLMGLQTDVNGSELDIRSRFLVVPRALKVLAQQAVGIVFAATTQQETSPFRSELEVVSDPRLDGSSSAEWYLFSSPAEVDTIEMAYLAGQREPYFETQQGFDVDGVKIKIRHERGFKAIDWRGMAKSTGV